MEEPKQSHRTAVLVAVISAAAIIAAAIVGPVIADRLNDEPPPARVRTPTEVTQESSTDRDYGFAGSFGSYSQLKKSVMLREGPSFESDVVTMLRPGTVVAVTQKQIEGDVTGDGVYWFPIKTEYGWRGWITEEDLE